VFATDLSPETMLQLAPGIRTRLDAAGHVLVDAPDGTIIDAGPNGFATLSMFARPFRLGAAIERLETDSNGSTDFVPTLSVINLLIEEGALVPMNADRVPTKGWADPVEHARMLHDDRRTSDYIAALRQAVRPGDIVLDIGTGSGVLAIAAARAGARHVYAVEASDIADVAERVFAANGVQGRVTLIRGWSREIELPEPADLLVAEVIGNEPLEEEILETTLDARRRLLKPNAAGWRGRSSPAPRRRPAAEAARSSCFMHTTCSLGVSTIASGTKPSASSRTVQPEPPRAGTARCSSRTRNC
jgi:Ribosomal protein L11 methyltransferase (PrmA)